MISIEEIAEIHKTLLDIFGGSQGIRDLLALESALARPFQTFAGKEFHPTYCWRKRPLVPEFKEQ